MRKMIQSIVLFILIVFCLAGCSRKTFSYPFLHPADEVVEIRIGIAHLKSSDAGEFLADGARRLETTAILSQEQQETLLNRLGSIHSWKRHFGEANVLSDGATVIYVKYQNGDFELINFSAQGKYTIGDFRKKYDDASQRYTSTGRYVLDEYIFNDLIYQTLEEIEETE